MAVQHMECLAAVSCSGVRPSCDAQFAGGGVRAGAGVALAWLWVVQVRQPCCAPLTCTNVLCWYVCKWRVMHGALHFLCRSGLRPTPAMKGGDIWSSGRGLSDI